MPRMLGHVVARRIAQPAALGLACALGSWAAPQPPGPVSAASEPAPVFVAGPGGRPQARSVAEGRADYRIEARVEDPAEGGSDGASKSLSGRLVLRWTNPTSAPADELWVHLYWNAVANDRSTHLTESGGSLRGRAFKDEWGWQQVTGVRCGEADLMPSFRYRQPDGGPDSDRSVFSVVPPRPVGPGESVEVEVDWTARFPRVRRRTGQKGDFLFAAHWFPKLGVLEEGRGWNCHEFHANTEFYSDYGWYDVTLDLPVRYDRKVFGSGLQVGPSSVEGARAITRFAAPSLQDRVRVDTTGKLPLVHGFTWTADPRYKLRRGTFNYDLWRSRFDGEVKLAQAAFGPEENLRLRTVEVSVLIHPEHEEQWERHLEATCAALFFYGLWFGEYPYEHITVVDPAWGAGAAGGMEYPTLFTAGTRMYTRPSMHTPESVTVHECGHQFWYGLVGNNEFEAAWLDEGFNSYTDSEVMWRVWGARRATTDYSGVPYDGVAPVPGPGGGTLASALSLRRIRLPLLGFDLEPLHPCGPLDLWRDQPQLTSVEQLTDPRWNDRTRYLSDPDRDPIDTHGWKYVDRSSYSTNSYPRTAAALRTLAGIVGRDAFLRGMRRYSETWRYRHPYPDAFFAAFQEGAGVDVGWYFDQVFRGTGTVDYQVSVERERVKPPRGMFQDQPGEPFAKAPAAKDEDEEDDSSGEGEASDTDASDEDGRPWRSTVLLVRKGELCLPLTTELRFEDGSSERLLWTREEQQLGRWTRIRLEERPELVAVLLDPDGLNYLDADRSNDRWFDQTDRLAPVRWSERAFNRWLHLLFWQAGIGG